MILRRGIHPPETILWSVMTHKYKEFKDYFKNGDN